MATSTILRVKRKIEDNPQDALVLLCKRIKTDTEEISPSLFVFRGTVDNQETKAVKEIVPKTDLKLKSAHDVSEIIQKIRNERKEATHESRYEVVNCRRGIKECTDEDVFDLVDLQKTSDEEKNVQYAYDLYIAAKQEEFDVSMLDNLVSIENYETNLIVGSCRDNGLNADSDDDGDDDSNDENNWRNDYPDTEGSSIGEDDIIKAMENCELDNDLSSDNGEEKIYDEPPDLFKQDENHYGTAYAKYKAKVMKECPDFMPTSLIQCSKVKDINDESSEGYKDDEDGFYYGQDEDTEQFRKQYSDISSDEYVSD